MRLGQQVLQRISELLVQIDRPKAVPGSRKVARHEERSAKQSSNGEISKTNTRLYDNYRRLRDRALEREKQKIKCEIQTMQQFKVDNKHSIFLNTRNNLRPIHQRTSSILMDKQLSVEKMRIQLRNQKQKRDKQLESQYEQQNQDSRQGWKMRRHRKTASKIELDEIVNRLTLRDRQRNDKINREKMDYLKSKLLNNRDKPSISKNTQKIWQRRKNKLSLSSNVFQRLDHYLWDQKKTREQFINNIRQKETPFKPNITRISVEGVSKIPEHNSRTEITRKMEESRSERNILNKRNEKIHIDISNETKHKKSNSFKQNEQGEQVKHVKSEIQLTPYRL